jgi:RNA polymerase sigma-70 factor (ECF subfamily)
MPAFERLNGHGHFPPFDECYLKGPSCEGHNGRQPMKRVAAVLLAVASAFAVMSARADDVTLQSVPPVVVKTIPEAGTGDVDPGLTEIKVTFSKGMQDGSWSWVTVSKETFPTVDGKPRYVADKRTCVLPVKLEAGKTYAIWLNSEKFGNFKDPDGHPAVPYLLVFQTKNR